MDRGGDEFIGWSIDGVAAGLLGAAIGACLLMLGYPVLAVIAGPAMGMAALAGLRQVRPEPRCFRLPAFALEAVPLHSFERERPAEASDCLDVLVLTEVFHKEIAERGAVAQVAQTTDASEPLELEDRLPEPAEDSRVVQLFAPRPLPTPGELARRIDHHLGGIEDGRSGRVFDLEVDAAAALRNALGDLRRSLA